jgi:hypothetical protein
MSVSGMSERMIGAIIAFVTVVVTLLAIALVERASSETKVQCVSQEDQERILRMSIQAVDQGFQAHVANLFHNWVTDAAQQPARAQTGMQNGIRAWVRAQDDAKKWAPPICPQ